MCCRSKCSREHWHRMGWQECSELPVMARLGSYLLCTHIILHFYVQSFRKACTFSLPLFSISMWGKYFVYLSAELILFWPPALKLIDFLKESIYNLYLLKLQFRRTLDKQNEKKHNGLNSYLFIRVPMLAKFHWLTKHPFLILLKGYIPPLDIHRSVITK